MTNLTTPTPEERAAFTALCAAKAMQHALRLLSEQKPMTPAVAKIVADSELDWATLIDTAKATLEAPSPAAGALTDSSLKNAPAAPQNAPATPLDPPPVFPPTLRPAFDTRTLCERGPKIAGQ